MSAPMILYVMGRSRSGTTLLGNLLGQTTGFFHAGELRRIWQHLSGATDPAEIPCSCGAIVRECVVWSAVGDRMLADPDVAVAPETVEQWRRQTARLSHAWKIPAQRRFLSTPAARGYARAMRGAHRAIAEVTGARVIVDISKGPVGGFFLRATPDVPHAFVHMTRDPRAVMHSWARQTSWPDGRGPTLRRYDALGSAVRWDLYNLLAEYVRHSSAAGESIVLRYEDLVANPDESLSAVGALVGQSVAAPPRDATGAITLEAGHVLGGNPSKFKTESVQLREDDEWRNAMAPRTRVLGTLLTLPLLWRYRYPVRSSRPPGTMPSR